MDARASTAMISEPMVSLKTRNLALRCDGGRVGACELDGLRSRH